MNPYDTSAPEPAIQDRPILHVDKAPKEPEGIHARAMLVKCSISSWDARRFDRKVTSEIAASHGLKSEVGRFSKHLLGGRREAPAHAEACARGAAVRVEFYRQTLLWSDEGWRLLPTRNFEAFTKAMREKRASFEESVERFLREYPRLKERARTLLGEEGSTLPGKGMYREEEYPSVDELRGRFGLSIDFSPLPATGDFRLDLSADQLHQVESDTACRVQSAIRDAVDSAWDRLRGSVAKLRDKLADADGIFRDSLISNVRDTVDVLARLNVTNCPDLEKTRVDVQERLASLSPDMLRRDRSTRERATITAERILQSMPTEGAK